MSIEQELARIADALEKIAGTSTPTVEVPAEPVKEKKAKKVADAVPGPMGLNIEVSGIKNSSELRDYAQRVAAAAEKAGKTQEFVTYVKNEVCPKFNPKEPKLISIPVENVQEAAQMICDYADAKGIIIG